MVNLEFQIIAMLRNFLHILISIVFLMGTVPFSSVISMCQMKMEDKAFNSCLCEVKEDDSALISQEGMLCCSEKKFEKGNVQDFVNFKNDALKLISIQVDLKVEIIPFSSLVSLPALYSHPISPPKLDLPILNSSLLI